MQEQVGIWFEWIMLLAAIEVSGESSKIVNPSTTYLTKVGDDTPYLSLTNSHSRTRGSGSFKVVSPLRDGLSQLNTLGEECYHSQRTIPRFRIKPPLHNRVNQISQLKPVQDAE